MKRPFAFAFLFAALFAGCQASDERAQGDRDPESNTTWNLRPEFTREQGWVKAVGLKSFDGLEDPTMKFIAGAGTATKPAAKTTVTAAPDAPRPTSRPVGTRPAGTRPARDNGPAGEVVRDTFANITDEGNGVVKMLVRYRGDWWDGDQGTTRKDRQRAEIKGLGPHQKMNETFEYCFTFRTNPDFTDPAELTAQIFIDPISKRRRHFCHLFQLKATDGDAGAPMITLSVEEGNKQATVDYWGGSMRQPAIAAAFNWKPGEWNTVTIRVKTSSKQGANDGGVWVNLNGKDLTGVAGVEMFRARSSDYRPKWGLYRAAGAGSGAHDDWVEHKDVMVRKVD